MAIEIPPDVVRRAEQVMLELDALGASVRWVKAENLHLTLQFLGDVQDADLYAICQAVKRGASEHEPFQVTCRGLGAFPKPERPQTIWLGIDDPDNALAQFQKSVELELFELGFPKELRPYKPHLTLGRVARGKSDERLQSAIAADAGEWEAVIDADECVLFGSQLQGGGPVYSVLGRFPLGA